MLEQTLDIFGYFLWLCLRSEPSYHFARLGHQEFGEVPLNGFGSQEARFFGLQKLIQRMRRRAVHIDLGKERKCHAEIERTELFDFRLSPRFLRSKLVAREP